MAKLTSFPFSEETVTETVLLDLASALSHVVHVVPFTKPQEGQTGVDWEWCLYDKPGNRYLRFLVQAKVLDDKERNYAHIDRYIGNTSVRQIDRLADTSLARGVPAIYAFYNHLNDGTRVPANHCPCYQCLQCWGASIAPLDAVLAALPDKSFDTLRHVSMPWVCLLCAGRGLGPSADPISGALDGLARLDAIAGERYPDAVVVDLPRLGREPEREPPAYLRELLSSFETRSMKARAQAIARVARDNPGVDGVILVDANRGQPD